MPYRVVQWATGNVGRHALRAIANHPDLELAGLVVMNPDKAGRDAGELAGLDHPLGVIATADPAAVDAIRADCVLHMPLPSAQVGADPDLDTKVICHLLETGKNVVTTVGFVYPKAHGPELVQRLEAACAAGKTSVHGTGLNPGFMNEVVPLVLSGLVERVDRVYVRESSEFSRYPSPQVILGMMGFGLSPADYQEHTHRYRRWLSGLFVESLHMVADGLGRPVDDVEAGEDVELATDDYELAAGLVREGTVAGQRWVWRGLVGGEPFVELEAVYRAHPAVMPAWGPTGWLLQMDGAPNVTLDLDRWISNGLLATAMHAVHAVGPVVRAEPGIRTFLDLPMIVGHAGPRAAH
jgi:4-hydroxy-tetrahydrodipicolinate reductase